MKPLYFISRFILPLSVLFSCSQKNIDQPKRERKEPKDIASLIKSDSLLTFPLDSTSTPSSMCIQYYEAKNGQRFLVALNHLTRSIAFYDYDHPEKQFRISVPESGPNGINQLDGIYVRNFDSILVANYYQMNFIDST